MKQEEVLSNGENVIKIDGECGRDRLYFLVEAPVAMQSPSANPDLYPKRRSDQVNDRTVCPLWQITLPVFLCPSERDGDVRIRFVRSRR